MFFHLVLALVQTGSTNGFPSLPPRDHQPEMVDPGLHGGRPAIGVQATPGGGGDLSPDGRLLVFTREMWDDEHNVFRPALQVGAVDPDNMVRDGTSLSFYNEGPGSIVGGQALFGTDYAMPMLSYPETDAYFLEWSPRVLSTVDSYSCAGVAPGTADIDLDVLPNLGRLHTLTVALKPTVLDNPRLDPVTQQLTYELSMVMTHFPITPAEAPCGATPLWYAPNGYWVRTPATFGTLQPSLQSVFIGRDLTVVLDPSVPEVVSATLGPASRLQLEAPTGTGGTSIVGTEPTITADGRLLVYHGDGGVNSVTSGLISYVFNDSNPYDPIQGWSVPKPIHEIFTDGNIDPDLYPLAEYEIREPLGMDGQYRTYAQAGKLLHGAYPWVSKDGSFLMATHAYSAEAGDLGSIDSSRATRSALVAVGDITGGYVKLVDDAGVNPTRLGGDMLWPPTGNPLYDVIRDSQATTFFSTGLEPGLWQPFPGQDVTIPVTQADQRIPVLPVFIHRTRAYGEVRFEEADGNYALYLACNEALTFNGVGQAADPTRTPDTSGRPSRLVCTLQGGAQFPQEYVAALGQSSPYLRNLTGLAATGASGNYFHENLGFKGQALLFPPGGKVSFDAPLGYGDAVTLQAFVKVLPGWNAQPLVIFDDPGASGGGRLRLRLLTNGRFEARVRIDTASESGKLKTATSRPSALDEQPDPFDRTLGWRHVAVVFDGSASRLLLYLDGVVERTILWTGGGTFTEAPGAARVGPGAPAGSNPVLMLDEVAVSSVVRTSEELRRDAYVAPLPDGSQPWPELDLPLELGLEAEDTFWPAGVDFDQQVADLGDALFSSTVLSSDGSRSCATCHEPGYGFAEPLPLALAIDNVTELDFNTPSVFNMGFGKQKLFDGSASTLEDQVLRPIQSGAEMGVQTIQSVVARLNATPPFDTQFPIAFGEAATAQNLKVALSMYLRTLVSGNSRVDQYEAGNPSALSQAQIRGRGLFHGKARCATCHTGSNYTDGGFHNIGTVPDTGSSVTGLGGFTGRASEEGMLKTPSLRNLFLLPKVVIPGAPVATGPFFHDGSKANLSAVINHYDMGGVSSGIKGTLDRTLFPLNLTPQEKQDLEAFLKALIDPNPPQ